MSELRLLSWNVNGIRAVLRKGTLAQVLETRPDILCLQETKASEGQIDLPFQAKGYHAYYSSGEKKGYSGVMTLTRPKPVKVQRGFGDKRFDTEGRILITDYASFTLLNIYFPNGKMSQERLDYKMAFYDAFLEYADALKANGKKLVICGDVNTAHKEIDIARPRENSKKSGFLPMEREWIDKFLSHGYVDTYRVFDPGPDKYTYWDMKTGARERNIGWRIDYFYVSDNLFPSLKSAFIMPEILGSDHCPIGITLANCRY